MSTATYLVGDVFDRLAEIPDGSVDLVMTSPPFLALRSYLPAGHPDKGREIGQEPTPAAFIDTLLALTAEWRRVLAPHGSIAVELGDTYSGSGGAGGDYNPGGLRDGQAKFTGSNSRRGRVIDHDSGRRSPGAGWPLAKSMVGIPHLYHLSLAYGRNLLTGADSPAGEWRVRNVVAWVRPNPPVGALGDKFRPATSYVTIACTSQRRYFDLDAVRHHNARVHEVSTTGGREQARVDVGLSSQGSVGQPVPQNPAGAPPLDWWEIPTQPYSGSHYATFPEALVVQPIEAMCPRKVCRVCGKPSRRIAETTNAVGKAVGRASWRGENGTDGIGQGHSGDIEMDANDSRVPDAAERVTLGWTDCGHDDWRPGLVLDPFAGSGTTLAVATARGRDAIGIDLDERNLDLARERIGMWLQEDVA